MLTGVTAVGTSWPVCRHSITYVVVLTGVTAVGTLGGCADRRDCGTLGYVDKNVKNAQTQTTTIAQPTNNDKSSQ